jgi:hypothetical protein
MKSSIWKKIYSAEEETPLVFWSMYIIFLAVMMFYVYFAFIYQSRALFILIGLVVISAILFPVIFLYKQRRKKK